MSLTVLDKIKAYKLVEIENDKKVRSLLFTRNKFKNR